MPCQQISIAFPFMPKSLSLERLPSGCVVLWFDSDANVNTLNAETLAELDSAIGTLKQDAEWKDVQGLILATKKPNSFLAGADLPSLAANLDRPKTEISARCERVTRVFSQLAELPFPVVAAIQGHCLGGGLELALWADDRVASLDNRTEIGLPEVKLGLVPGWSGCVRLPRVIGLGGAVSLISSGETLSATVAHAAGILATVAQPDSLIPSAEALVRIRHERGLNNLPAERERLRLPIDFAEAELGLLSASAHALLSKSLFNKAIAPRRAIDLTIEASQRPETEALALETQTLCDLYGSAENRALLHVFFADQRLRKSQASDQSDSDSQIKKVGIVGAGIMGAGIAAANLKIGNDVLLLDANEDALRLGAKTAIEFAAYDKHVKRTTKEKAIAAASLLTATHSQSALARADLVIEAIVETLSVKQELFRQLEQQCDESTILASNTSTISVSKIAEAVQNRERCCGLHFFNPVHRMKLVEVIRGEHTSEETIQIVANHVRQLGKKPIIVNDSPGFLVNRLLVPYLNETLELLHEGAAVKQIDAAARNFGMPMGPLQLYDMVGLDTAVKAGTTIWQAYPDRVTTSPLISRLVKLKRLGEKNGLGFYKHGTNKNGRPQADPDFEKIQSDYLYNKGPSAAKLTSDQIAHRLLLPMLLEATRVLDEGIVADPAAVDVGVIYGLGFPAFKGGLLGWADQVGAKQLQEWIRPWESLGARWQPTERFKAMVEANQTFHNNESFSL
jgi:3-hydroxyacyl-CoA dehydrogenase/enoyl-CoA hydratase/carnithine racemase